jgi:hypothetical protein
MPLLSVLLSVGFLGSGRESRDLTPLCITATLSARLPPWVIRYRCAWRPLRAMSAVPRKPTLGSSTVSVVTGQKRTRALQQSTADLRQVLPDFRQ